MTTPSSKSSRVYARFIPSEEVGDVTQWKFGAVDGSDLAGGRRSPEEEAAPPPTHWIEEAHQQALEQAARRRLCQGQAQGHAQASAGVAAAHGRLHRRSRPGGGPADRCRGAGLQAAASLADMQQHMAQDMLHLACDIARQVLRHELSFNPNAVQPVVREAVGMLVAEGRPATVRLNPQDHGHAGSRLAAEDDGAARAVGGRCQRAARRLPGGAGGHGGRWQPGQALAARYCAAGPGVALGGGGEHDGDDH